MGNQGTVRRLESGNGAQGEGAANGSGLACHPAHSQQHQDEGQLVRDHRHHLTAQADAGIGRAGGGCTHDEGYTRHRQQVQDDHQVGAALNAEP